MNYPSAYARFQKITSWVANWAGILAVIGIVYFTATYAVYWKTPLQYERIEGVTHYIEQKEYKRGDMVMGKIKARKETRDIGYVTWTIYGDNWHHTYPTRPGTLVKGCNVKLNPIEIIPMDAPSGKLHFHGTVEYRGSVIPVEIEIVSNEFTVK